MALGSTIALIGLGLTAASTATNYVGQRKQAKLAEQQGDYEAMLFGRNADAADAQAVDAERRGRELESDVERGARQLAGEQRTAFAAQGIAIDDSAADVIENDADLFAVDKQRIRTNAAREAMGFRQDAENYRMQGDWAHQSGKSQARALRNQSVATLLTGAAQLANAYQSSPKRVSRPSSIGYGKGIYTNGMFGTPGYGP